MEALFWLGWRDSDLRKNHFNKVVLCFYGVFMPFSGVYMFCKRNSIILNTEKTRSKARSKLKNTNTNFPISNYQLIS